MVCQWGALKNDLDVRYWLYVMYTVGEFDKNRIIRISSICGIGTLYLVLFVVLDLWTMILMFFDFLKIMHTLVYVYLEHNIDNFVVVNKTELGSGYDEEVHSHFMSNYTT